MYRYSDLKQYERVVDVLIQIRSTIDKLKSKPKLNDIEEQAEIDIQVTKTERVLEDIVSEIGQDAFDLAMFAYELRKRDPNDQYTHNLLNGQIRPPVLIDIILSNRWNAKDGCMQANPERAFRMMICDKKILECSSGNELVKVGKIHSKQNREGHSNMIQFLLTKKGMQI